MKAKTGLATVLSLVSVLAAATLLVGSPPVPPEEVGSINNHFTVSDKALQGRPVMISVIRGSQVVEQQETGLPSDRRITQVQPGAYDVRVEGDGVVTEVKRGVHVFANRELDLVFLIHAGKGVHIVEYAAGGLSREEVAARLEKLEASVAQLQKALAPK